MEEDRMITLNDEDGREVRFEFLDLIEYQGGQYVVLLPEEDDDAQVVILEMQEYDDENESFEGVDDEDVLNAVFEIFKDRNRDVFNFEG